jgi:hypothetical protein
MKHINRVVIVAAGDASRLYPLTKYIPKILVNVRGKSMLCRILDYWRTYADKFTIIIKPKFRHMVQEYIKIFYGPDDISVNIIDFSESSGTTDTIRKCVIPEERIVFTWCDVCPIDCINTHKLENEIVVFTDGNQHRYMVDGDRLIEQENGNVCGIYYFRDFKAIEGEGHDLADTLKSNVTSMEIKVLDMGDMNKFILESSINNDEIHCRFFNRISVKDNIVSKDATTAYGVQIINREIGWYEEAKRLDCVDNIAQIIGINNNRDGFKMHVVRGDVIFRIFDDLPVHKRHRIVAMYLRELEEFHKHTKAVDNEQFETCIETEIIDKIINRYYKIKQLLDIFGNIHTVNGVLVQPFDECINRVNSIVKRYYKDTERLFSFIHGDCQFGNSIYDSVRDKIIFIDPRGYFGTSINYGVKEYDFAKLLFALSGYDSFNVQHDFMIDALEDGCIEFKIHTYDIDYTFATPVVKAFMVSIWLGLAQYFQNDVQKCVCTYYHSLYLATTLLFDET